LPVQLKRVAQSKRAAEKAVESAADAAAVDAARNPNLPDGQWTPRQVWDEYRESEHWTGCLSDRSKEAYESTVRRLEEDWPEWLDMPLEEAVSQVQWDRLLRVTADRRGTAEARMLRTALRPALRLVDNRVSLWNIDHMKVPSRELKNPGRIGRDPQRALTRTEFNKLVECARDGDGSSVQVEAGRFVLLNSYLALRFTELASLEWDQVNVESGVVRAVSTKTGADYPAKTLPGDLRGVLSGLRKGSSDSHVFSSSHTALGRAVAHVFDRAGLPWARNHNLRKTVGGFVFDRYGVRAASAWLGHRTVGTTLKYYVKMDGSLPSGVLDLKNEA
jgi:integrase